MVFVAIQHVQQVETFNGKWSPLIRSQIYQQVLQHLYPTYTSIPFEIVVVRIGVILGQRLG